MQIRSTENAFYRYLVERDCVETNYRAIHSLHFRERRGSSADTWIDTIWGSLGRESCHRTSPNWNDSSPMYLKALGLHISRDSQSKLNALDKGYGTYLLLLRLFITSKILNSEQKPESFFVLFWIARLLLNAMNVVLPWGDDLSVKCTTRYESQFIKLFVWMLPKKLVDLPKSAERSVHLCYAIYERDRFVWYFAN